MAARRSNFPLTQERLKQVLTYDPATGVFSWWPGRLCYRPGRSAGSVRPNGRRMIGIDGKLYAASQLAFLYMRGFLPEPEADHRNGNNSDDRWDNLREATRSQQLINRVTRNKTGQRGVYHHAFSGLYRAAIKVDGRVKSLGYFRSAEEAGAAYRAASMAQHGEFSVFRRQ